MPFATFFLGLCFYLHPCRTVLHDRDTKFCASFRSVPGCGRCENHPAAPEKSEPECFRRTYWIETKTSPTESSEKRCLVSRISGSVVLCVSFAWLGGASSSLGQGAPAIPTRNADQSATPSPVPNSNADNGSPENPSGDSRDPIWYPGDTESFRPLVKKLAANILLDQKEIWAAPFHMRRGDAPWWILGGVGTAALIATDHTTIDALRNSKGQITAASHVSQIGATYTVLPLIAGFYGFGVLTDNAKARETGVLGTEALLDSLVVVAVLKTVTGRVRPDSTTGNRGEFFHRGDSFPSGHTMETWAIASVIAHEYKRGGGRWVPYVAYGLATTVSAARYIGQRHYLSDVVAGGAMGWFIGRYVYQTHENHAAHRLHIPKSTISPDINPATKKYAVSIRLGS